MTVYDIQRLALVLAVQAEIEGMKAENEFRKQNGDSIAYREDHFKSKAQDLRDWAYTHDHQL